MSTSACPSSTDTEQGRRGRWRLPPRRRDHPRCWRPLLAPHDEALATRFQDILFSPSSQYWLGTDHVGRDIASRLMFGARYALFAGAEAVVVALAIGVPLGLLIGYFRGWVDAVVMQIVETVVAVPAIVMAMAIIAGLGVGLTKAMLAVGIVYSMVITRLHEPRYSRRARNSTSTARLRPEHQVSG